MLNEVNSERISHCITYYYLVHNATRKVRSIRA